MQTSTWMLCWGPFSPASKLLSNLLQRLGCVDISDINLFTDSIEIRQRVHGVGSYILLTPFHFILLLYYQLNLYLKEEEEEEDLVDPATEIKEGCADSACFSLKETNIFLILFRQYALYTKNLEDEWIYYYFDLSPDW